MSPDGRSLTGVIDMQDAPPDMFETDDVLSIPSRYCQMYKPLHADKSVLYHYVAAEKQTYLVFSYEGSADSMRVKEQTDLAWMPFCPSHRHIYALTAYPGIVLPIDASQHILLERWSLEELLGQAAESMHGEIWRASAEWSWDGRHLTVSMTEGRCVILSFA